MGLRVGDDWTGAMCWCDCCGCCFAFDRTQAIVPHKKPDIQGVQEMLMCLSLAIGHRVQPTAGNHYMDIRRAATFGRISHGYA